AANAILTKANTITSPLISPLALPLLLPTASWVDLGPSGVPASGLVVNESTAGTSPTIFSGRTTAIAVAPNCSLASCTVFIGTAVARLGSSSVNGGRFAPPGAAKVGLYESTDGGAHFTAAKILAQDVVAPGSANGGDFFRGGCSHIELYRPGSETQVYASFF